MQGSTTGRAAPFRFTTIRLDAHITSDGLLCRMPQQASVISGTSACTSISGNNTSEVAVVSIDRANRGGDQSRVALARVRFVFAPAGAPGKCQRETLAR